MRHRYERIALLGLVAAVGCTQDYGISTVKEPDVELAADTDPGLGLDSDTDVGTPDTDVPADSADPTTDDGVVVAAAPVYANTTDRLYTVDPTTGTATLVGQFHEQGTPIDGFVDIAIDGDGRLFGGTQGTGAQRTGRAVYRVDPITAGVTHVCDLNADMHGMAFLPDGRLVVAGRETMFAVDVDRGCGLALLGLDDEHTTSGDLVQLPDGRLYWTVWGDEPGASDHLVVLDPNGLDAPVDRGEIGFDRLYGLGYDQQAHQLYGFSADGEVVAINVQTAVGSVIGTLATAWWGATTNPVIWQTP